MAMIAALTNILFLATILAIVGVAAMMIQERRAAIAAALTGRSAAARPLPQLRFSGRAAVRQQRTLSVQPQLRAAA
jgi:hypothetical protein